jgi:hypothetical protein
LKLALPMGVNVESMDSKFFFIVLLEVILHRVRDQRSRWE